MATPSSPPDRRRTVLVTGGTGGLGVAVVETLLAAGWRVVTTYRSERSRGRLPESDGLVVEQADLTDESDAERVAKVAAQDTAAPLRALVNLVGGYAGDQRIVETPFADFAAMFELNLRSTYLATQAALPHLIDASPSAIVCTGSRAAFHPFAGAAGYCVAKSGVATFARTVAAEYASDGVRCNTVVPFVIGEPTSADSQVVSPFEIARVISFLCDEASQAVNGAVIPVYGARSPA